MSGWLLRLSPATPAAWLLPLAGLGGLQLRRAPDAWLLRGPGPLPAAARGLPAEAAFDADDDGRLTRPGRRLPEGLAPADGWEPLADAVRLAPARTAWPGEAAERATPRWRRGGPARPAAGVATDLGALATWAGNAPAARLAPLRWARRDNDALVWAEAPAPLPPGARRFHRLGSLLVPLGFHPAPALPAEELAAALGLSAGDTAWLTGVGTERLDAWADAWPDARPDAWVRVPAGAGVPLTRAGVREAATP